MRYIIFLIFFIPSIVFGQGSVVRTGPSVMFETYDEMCGSKGVEGRRFTTSEQLWYHHENNGGGALTGPAVTGRPCVWQLATGTSGGGNTSGLLSNIDSSGFTVNYAKFDMTDQIEFRAIIKLTQSDSNTVVRAGFFTSPAASTPSQGCWIEKAAADTTWFLNCTDGSGTTRANTSVNTGTSWVVVGVRNTGSNTWKARAASTWAGLLSATETSGVTANVPTGSARPFIDIGNNATTNDKLLQVDAAFTRIWGIAQR